MPRPLRIEYENAYYHVMNRGRARQRIFSKEIYYQTFLETLAEACERFQLIVHAYCLMSNHYHLLLQTPQANLGRLMRHINGVYTQRYNRLKKTDGPLFRGRYKAIVIDADRYLLQLSRYIHRNPVELRTPLVQKLEQYPWSSYPAYINQVKAPEWLQREQIYQMLGIRQKYKAYQQYVAQGIDEDMQRFYSRGNMAAVMGEKTFVSWLRTEKVPQLNERTVIQQVLSNQLTIDQFIALVAQYYQLTVADITNVVKGPKKGLVARKFAMYLCQQMGGYALDDIRTLFGLSNRGSVSFITSQIRNASKRDPMLERETRRLKDYIINNAT